MSFSFREEDNGTPEVEIVIDHARFGDMANPRGKNVRMSKIGP